MTADILDGLVGLAPDSPIALLRRQRDAFVKHTQGSHAALITPADPGGLTLAERAAVALRVATLEGDGALIAQYQARQRQLAADALTPRLAAILRHVELVTAAPASATQADIAALRAVGLTPRDIVVITQIVAFVSYQIRVAAGLRALAAETRA